MTLTITIVSNGMMPYILERALDVTYSINPITTLLTVIKYFYQDIIKIKKLFIFFAGYKALFKRHFTYDNPLKGSQ